MVVRFPLPVQSGAVAAVSLLLLSFVRYRVPAIVVGDGVLVFVVAVARVFLVTAVEDVIRIPIVAVEA